MPLAPEPIERVRFEVSCYEALIFFGALMLALISYADLSHQEEESKDRVPLVQSTVVGAGRKGTNVVAVPSFDAEAEGLHHLGSVPRQAK